MHSFLVALAFLTVLPVRFSRPLPDSAVAASRLWYPVVGLLVGTGLGLACYGLACSGLSPSAQAFLLLALWVAVSGALHIDGFCDLCDGLFGGRTPEDRLRILKDPHLGTFALVGGVLLLLGKYTALADLFRAGHALTPGLVGLAALVLRCLLLTAAAGARYPREEGTGKILVESVRVWEGLAAALLAVGLAMLVLRGLGVGTGVAVGVTPVLVTVVVRVLCTRRLGGMTGDCLGAAVELNELLLLWVAVALTGRAWG